MYLWRSERALTKEAGMGSWTQGGVHPGQKETEEKAVSVGQRRIPLLGSLLKEFILHGITFLLRRQLICWDLLGRKLRRESGENETFRQPLRGGRRRYRDGWRGCRACGGQAQMPLGSMGLYWLCFEQLFGFLWHSLPQSKFCFTVSENLDINFI